MKLHCFVIALIGALSLLGVFANANPIAGGQRNKIEKRDTITAASYDERFESFLLKREGDSNKSTDIIHTETVSVDTTTITKHSRPTTTNTDNTILDDSLIDHEEATIHRVIVILCSLGASLFVVAIAMACLYCKVRKQQKDLGHVRKELEDDGENGSKSRYNGSKSRYNGSFWNRERAANNASNASSITERGRRLSNEDRGRVSNKMDDDRHSLTEMEAQAADISDTRASTSVTLPPPAVITTDSPCTVQLASIPLQQLSRPIIRDFPPAFTSLTDTLSMPSAPMAAELVSNSETDGDVKIDLAGNEDTSNTNDTNRTNRSISRFDSLREIDELDDLGFYSELPMISPPAYTPTAPPVCNLPHLPIPEYDRHRIQDMVLYTSAPPRRRLQPNTSRDGENESTNATLADNNNRTSTANTQESSELNYPSPPPPILTTRRSRVARSNTEDDR